MESANHVVQGRTFHKDLAHAHITWKEADTVASDRSRW